MHELVALPDAEPVAVPAPVPTLTLPLPLVVMYCVQRLAVIDPHSLRLPCAQIVYSISGVSSTPRPTSVESCSSARSAPAPHSTATATAARTLFCIVAPAFVDP